MHEVCAIVGEKKNWKGNWSKYPESSISLNILHIKLLLNSFPFENDFCNFLIKFDLILLHAVYIDQNTSKTLKHNILFFIFLLKFLLKLLLNFFPCFEKTVSTISEPNLILFSFVPYRYLQILHLKLSKIISLQLFYFLKISPWLVLHA